MTAGALAQLAVPECLMSRQSLWYPLRHYSPQLLSHCLAQVLSPVGPQLRLRLSSALSPAPAAFVPQELVSARAAWSKSWQPPLIALSLAFLKLTPHALHHLQPPLLLLPYRLRLSLLG